jgi:uncharacterized membrane protein
VPDTVFGVPLHPLVNHAAVVLVPLAVLGTLLITVVPRWRTVYGWLVVALAAVAFATVPVVTRSGRNLEASLELGGPVLDKVREHQEMGDRVIWAMFVLDLVLMLMHRAGRPTGQANLVAVLASIAGLVALVLVVLTGHLGAQAVWNPAG